MNFTLRKTPIFLLLLSLALIMIDSSCKKKDSEVAPVQKQVEDNGLTKDINELVPPDILQKMRDLDMPINPGGNPPELSGLFLGSKFILKESIVPGDFIGFKYPDFKVQFSGFNPFDLAIRMDYRNGFESGAELGAFIVGEGDKFSVFAEVISIKESDSANFAFVISGEMVNDTIRNLHVANFMLDNHGNEDLIWMENGEGRILYDRDGISEPIDEEL